VGFDDPMENMAIKVLCFYGQVNQLNSVTHLSEAGKSAAAMLFTDKAVQGEKNGIDLDKRHS
jgi:hypothetical protein